MNNAIFRAINGCSDSLAPLMHFLSEATNTGWVRIVLGLLVIAMIVRGPRSRATAIQALIAVVLANASTDLFKHFLPEPRPYQELSDALMHTGNLVATMRPGEATNFGTASAHSANMAAVAVVFCVRLKWWGAPWVVIALGVGFSRIYLAAHYPYQVLLGYSCGLAVAFAVVKTWDLVAGRIQPEQRNLPSGTTDLT